MYPEILEVAKRLKMKGIDFDLEEWEDGYCISVDNDCDQDMQAYQYNGSYLSELGLIEIVVYNDLYDYKSYADVDYVVDFIVKFMNLMEEN